MATNSVITTVGKQIILDRVYEVTPTKSAPQQFKVGITQADITTGTTALTLPVPIDSTEAIDDFEDYSTWTAGTDTALADNTSTFKENATSMSVAKSGTSGTSMSASKTVTSRDFTSKRFNIWIYITALSDLVTSGTAITIRYGSDSSNYYYLNTDISSLSSGWNYIIFTSATATGTTGSPVIATCDYLAIFFNTDLVADTIAANRILVDDANVASDDDFLKDFVSGYPSINNTTLESTYRCYLDSLQANGFDLDGVMILNKDGTPLVFAVDKFGPESKGNTDEFAYVFIDRQI